MPCPAHRLTELHRLLRSLQHPAEQVVLVTTQPAPVPLDACEGLVGHRVLDDDPGINIARWWNLGLAHIAALEGDAPHEVLVTSSDITGGTGSVDLLADTLRRENLVMVGPDWHHSLAPGEVLRLTGPRNVFDRVQAGCFMLAGEHGLRLDERYRWWYEHDDLEMQARQIGAVGLVGADLTPGPDSGLNDETQKYADDGRRLFVDTWAVEPW